MKSREENLETLLVACRRLLMKEKHYHAQVPKVLEQDFKLIEDTVTSLTGLDTKNQKLKQEQGDLA